MMQRGGSMLEQSNSSQVNVQTSTQPVLVVPLNMAQQQAPPAEYIGTATPGAPPTFAVDTGERSMKAVGLDVSQRKSASRSPGRTTEGSSSQRSSSSSQINSSMNPTTRVNVIKEG
jgi:hypothetical protein